MFKIILKPGLGEDLEVIALRAIAFATEHSGYVVSLLFNGVEIAVQEVTRYTTILHTWPSIHRAYFGKIREAKSHE